MVHNLPIDAVRRTVTRATRPALVPLRAAASVAGSVAAVATAGDHDVAEPLSTELEELAAMRDAGADAATDPAGRATRSASAYLEARRERLRRELRQLS